MLAKKYLKSMNEASMGDLGSAPKGVMQIVAGLTGNEYHSTNDKQMEMCKMMEELACSDEPMANDFMKHMDESASKYDPKRFADKKDPATYGG